MTGAHELRAEPATAEQLRVLIEGDDAFRRRYGIAPAEGWSSFDGVLEYSLAQVTEGDVDPAWSTHLFILGEELIGIGGFKGPPVGSAVEIGYEIAPAYRGRGLATEAARQLLAKAHAAEVSTVTAHTLAEENASTRVLTRLSFERTAELWDPDEGAVWRWERRLAGDSDARH